MEETSTGCFREGVDNRLQAQVGKSGGNKGSVRTTEVLEEVVM